jgi:hypothetical protein
MLQSAIVYSLLFIVYYCRKNHTECPSKGDPLRQIIETKVCFRE